MRPLRVTAELQGAIAMPYDPIALDALLAAAVATRDCLPPPDCEIRPIEIPVEREPGGRFHLATTAIYSPEGFERRWVNRRFPVERAQDMGPRVNTIRITGCPSKSYRIPMEAIRLKGDLITWFCVGDIEPIRALLCLVTHLGKRRAVGLGHVRQWTVEECDTWPGFPVLDSDGRPMRPLPVDWPGLRECKHEFRTLTYPYWDNSARMLVAVPC